MGSSPRGWLACGWVTLGLLGCLLTPPRAFAQEGSRELAVGFAPQLLVGLTNVCTREADVVGCTTVAFGGADVSAHAWPLDFLALGGRIGLAKDLDASEGVSENAGEITRWDPGDQWLWRLVAELRFDPPLLPGGLWIGFEGGLALLDETERSLDRQQVRSVSVLRVAPLLGGALGWDIWLGDSVTLTPELRVQGVFFDDPPELRPDVSAHDYRSAAWLELGVRLALLP